MSLRKYGTFMKINLQDSLVYRANAVVWMLVDALPAYTMLFIWAAVYKTTYSINGFVLSDMAAYYLAATFLEVALTPHMEYAMSYEIRHGLMSQHLLKPWSTFWAWVTGETAWQVVKGSTSIPLFAVVAWLFRDTLYLPKLQAWQWLVFVIAVALAYAINVGAKMALGTLAFWIVEPAGIMGIYSSLSWFLQGGLVPIDFFPSWLQIISNALPFKYSLAFPIMILLNRVPAGSLFTELFWAFFWAVFNLTLAWVIWRRGIRAYSAVGG